ncbi:MAG: hypothetical protein ACYDFR_04095, partial [Candidatus Omnitrophota bacterium]
IQSACYTVFWGKNANHSEIGRLVGESKVASYLKNFSNLKGQEEPDKEIGLIPFLRQRAANNWDDKNKWISAGYLTLAGSIELSSTYLTMFTLGKAIQGISLGISKLGAGGVIGSSILNAANHYFVVAPYYLSLVGQGEKLLKQYSNNVTIKTDDLMRFGLDVGALLGSSGLLGAGHKYTEMERGPLAISWGKVGRAGLEGFGREALRLGTIGGSGVFGVFHLSSYLPEGWGAYVTPASALVIGGLGVAAWRQMVVNEKVAAVNTERLKLGSDVGSQRQEGLQKLVDLNVDADAGLVKSKFNALDLFLGVSRGSVFVGEDVTKAVQTQRIADYMLKQGVEVAQKELNRDTGTWVGEESHLIPSSGVVYTENASGLPRNLQHTVTPELKEAIVIQHAREQSKGTGTGYKDALIDLNTRGVEVDIGGLKVNSNIIEGLRGGWVTERLAEQIAGDTVQAQTVLSAKVGDIVEGMNVTKDLQQQVSLRLAESLHQDSPDVFTPQALSRLSNGEKVEIGEGDGKFLLEGEHLSGWATEKLVKQIGDAEQTKLVLQSPVDSVLENGIKITDGLKEKVSLNYVTSINSPSLSDKDIQELASGSSVHVNDVILRAKYLKSWAETELAKGEIVRDGGKQIFDTLEGTRLNNGIKVTESLKNATRQELELRNSTESIDSNKTAQEVKRLVDDVLNSADQAAKAQEILNDTKKPQDVRQELLKELIGIFPEVFKEGLIKLSDSSLKVQWAGMDVELSVLDSIKNKSTSEIAREMFKDGNVGIPKEAKTILYAKEDRTVDKNGLKATKELKQIVAQMCYLRSENNTSIARKALETLKYLGKGGNSDQILELQKQKVLYAQSDTLDSSFWFVGDRKALEVAQKELAQTKDDFSRAEEKSIKDYQVIDSESERNAERERFINEQEKDQSIFFRQRLEERLNKKEAADKDVRIVKAELENIKKASDNNKGNLVLSAQHEALKAKSELVEAKLELVEMGNKEAGYKALESKIDTELVRKEIESRNTYECEDAIEKNSPRKLEELKMAVRNMMDSGENVSNPNKFNTEIKKLVKEIGGKNVWKRFTGRWTSDWGLKSQREMREISNLSKENLIARYRGVELAIHQSEKALEELKERKTSSLSVQRRITETRIELERQQAELLSEKEKVGNALDAKEAGITESLKKQLNQDRSMREILWDAHKQAQEAELVLTRRKQALEEKIKISSTVEKVRLEAELEKLKEDIGSRNVELEKVPGENEYAPLIRNLRLAEIKLLEVQAETRSRLLEIQEGNLQAFKEIIAKSNDWKFIQKNIENYITADANLREEITLNRIGQGIESFRIGYGPDGKPQWSLRFSPEKAGEAKLTASEQVQADIFVEKLAYLLHRIQWDI